MVLSILIPSREDAAQVLLKADAGLFCDAGGVGIDGLEKILDLLLNLPWDMAEHTVREDDLPWLDLVLLDLVLLDLVLHFRLHPYHPQTNSA